ncbi:MAG: phosphotransferase family protein [Actinomycetia bacterium]|nr:phosphotransferase family protein [Actinomycetes bacterium]MCP4224561.1 phosphotransferase family protein [Actinomycetes bacterium]MCP5030626.1 phosphotransferase family protein [Actinomycetes bacterium]
MVDSDPSDTPGYDRAAVEDWIEEHIEQLSPPCTWEQLEGGHSNLTYALTDHVGNRAVIRRPPLGELLPKAHDMNREFSIISGLGPTAVPVAKAYGLCEDLSVTGALFYLMSEVEGRAMYTAEAVEEWLTMEARETAGHSFMETLAALHSIEPDDVGLGQLGRREGYVARQLKTWYGSWNASVEGAELDDQRIHHLHELLSKAAPEQGPGRIVHGDYGLHNCMLGRDGTIKAVLDWEIATLGDPLADFAYALNGWGDPDDEVHTSHESATTAPGFARRDALADHYATITGADLTHLDYYRAFNYFKSACILHGVYARYLLGKKSTEGVDLPEMKVRLLATIDMAEIRAAGLG